MKNFWRSTRYLWPYRGRLAMALVCILVIAALWGGGFGMILPGCKILISPEGLHGWAWNALIEDKLNMEVLPQGVPAGIQVDGEPVGTVLAVTKLTGEAKKAKKGDWPIQPQDWIVGFIEDGKNRIISGERLHRKIAMIPEGEKLQLLVFNPMLGLQAASSKAGLQSKVVELRVGKAGAGASVLGWFARKLPEPKSRLERFSLLLWLMGIGLVLTFIRDGTRFLQEYIVQSVVNKGMTDLRLENYTVALRLPMTYFTQHGTSDTMSRFVQDTGEVSRGHILLFGKTLVEPAKAMSTLVFALLISWKLTLICLLAGPPVYLLLRKLGKGMRRASKRALQNWSKLLAVLTETLIGMRVVKAYTMETKERKRFFRTNQELFRQQQKIAAIDAAIGPVIESVGMVAAVAAVCIAGYLVLSGDMDASSFIAWLMTLMATFDPIRHLAKVATQFQRTEAAAARVFELQDREQEDRVQGGPDLPRHAKSIEFRHVSFRYPGGTEALKDISLTINAGEVVAVVGPNGSGKTTLVQMIPRLIDPAAGEVLIDGHDLRKVAMRGLRRQVGIVTQDTVLFNATIRENIGYGRARPKDKDIYAAARKAFVDEFVEPLPEKYETMIGEHGTGLSGGQRQRIAIARAILRDPSILIFDEATSQIDADSEHRIHQAMEEFIQGRTALIIAHRFATVLSADRIVVMNEGQIIDVGTHKELLGRCKLYEHLYRTQFSDAGG